MSTTSGDARLTGRGSRARLERLMAEVCEALLQDAECGIPVDVRLLASLQGAVVEQAEQAEAGLIDMKPRPPKKLRVRWTAGEPAAQLPRHKSVPDDGPIAGTVTERTVRYHGESTLISGRLHVHARFVPYRRDGRARRRAAPALRRP